MTLHFSLILVNIDGEVALLKQTDHNIIVRIALPLHISIL